MKLKNLNRWRLGPNTKGLLFFAQRLDELVFDFSLDSYKPPALNSVFLCEEAIELITEIESGSMEASNLPHVIEELEWSLRKDAVAKSLLDLDCSYYILHNDETPIATTKLRLEVLARTINANRYVNEIKRQLKVAVTSGAKADIDILAASLITTLLNMGMSKQWIHVKINEEFFSPQGPAIEDSGHLDQFLEKIEPVAHKYTVYACVSSLIKEVSGSVSAFRASIVDSVPSNLNVELSPPLSSDEVVIALGEIKAPDPYSARTAALGRLDQLCDLFTLFYHRAQISWREEVIVVQQCCNNETQIASEPRGPMEKAFDLNPARASKELNTLLRKFSARKHRESFNRFNRVADLHGLCVSHKVVDNQLVNLWIAFETLVPSHIGGSKITRVIRSVMPFLLRSYIRGLLNQLLFDLLNWDKWRTGKILKKVEAPKNAPSLDRLAILIATPEYENARQDLYSRLGDFELLRYRCFKLAEILSSKEKAKDLLNRHEKKVAWQLRRLYRARNLIVHTSRSPAFLSTLVTNGHDYLDRVIFDVIKLSSGEYSVLTIEQAFELGAVLNREFLLSVEGNGRITSSEALNYVRMPAALKTNP